MATTEIRRGGGLVLYGDNELGEAMAAGIIAGKAARLAQREDAEEVREAMDAKRREDMGGKDHMAEYWQGKIDDAEAQYGGIEPSGPVVSALWVWYAIIALTIQALWREFLRVWHKITEVAEG